MVPSEDIFNTKFVLTLCVFDIISKRSKCYLCCYLKVHRSQTQLKFAFILVLGKLFSVLALLFLHSNQVESYCERKRNPGNAPRNSGKTGRTNTGQYTSFREGQNPQQTTCIATPYICVWLPVSFFDGIQNCDSFFSLNHEQLFWQM